MSSIFYLTFCNTLHHPSSHYSVSFRLSQKWEIKIFVLLELTLLFFFLILTSSWIIFSHSREITHTCFRLTQSLRPFCSLMLLLNLVNYFFLPRKGISSGWAFFQPIFVLLYLSPFLPSPSYSRFLTSIKFSLKNILS